MSHAPHRRKDTRLPAFDYSEPGHYFLTIVLKNRSDLLGVVDATGTMILNDIGEMIEETWLTTIMSHPWTDLDAYIVMPDHVHAIVQTGGTVGVLEPVSVSKIVQRFKSFTTHAYGIGVREQAWPPYDGKLWQMNYYERIVRHDGELKKFRQYIEGNPGRWRDRRR